MPRAATPPAPRIKRDCLVAVEPGFIDTGGASITQECVKTSRST